MHGARPLRSTRRLQNLTNVLPRWWKIENKAPGAGPSLVSIYDEIGLYGVSAGDFLAEMREIPGDIELHLNSPGGDVFDGIAIYNQLKQAQKRGTVHVVVDGLAASAASFIAQAASPGHLEMAPHSQMMIHDGFAMGIGNAADMRELSSQLDKASDNIASIYAERSGKPAEFWREKMRAETWLSDAEAVEIGLADRIQGDENGEPVGWNLSVYSRFAGAVTNAAKKGGKSKKTAMNGDGDDDEDNGPKQLGDGWVKDPDGTVRFDPDGDGDDDSKPETDTDHGWWSEDGEQLKPIPPRPDTKGKKAKGGKKLRNATVDNSDWDADKAWHNGAQAENPSAFYAAICAGKKAGDPDTQAGWALPYRYTPDSPPNAGGVRAGLAALGGARGGVKGLINRAEAQKKLEGLMHEINPDYKPGDNIDTGLLSVFLTESLRGGTK